MNKHYRQLECHTCGAEFLVPIFYQVGTFEQCTHCEMNYTEWEEVSGK